MSCWHASPAAHLDTCFNACFRFVAESPQVERLIHFSDIGADVQHPSRRLSTKAEGDKALREIYPKATIVK